MIGYAKSKGAKNAVTFLPVDESAGEFIPWEPGAGIKGVNTFSTDPYWFLYNRDCREYVSEQMERTMQICEPHNLTPYFWAQGFGIPSGRENELETGFALAAERGAKSIAVWGMHGNAAWDGASENPEVVWDVVGKIFQVIRNKP